MDNGSCLRGLWHGASAGAALSAHLTLQLQPLTLQELLLAGAARGGALSLAGAITASNMFFCQQFG